MNLRKGFGNPPPCRKLSPGPVRIESPGPKENCLLGIPFGWSRVAPLAARRPPDRSHTLAACDHRPLETGSFGEVGCCLSRPRTEEKVHTLFSRNDSGVTTPIAISCAQ